MVELELWLLFTTLGGFFLGGMSINWARTESSPRLVARGRMLFIGTMLVLGGTGFVAAFQRASGLVPLGLVAGLLLVAMLWESPVVVEKIPQSLRQ